MATTTIAAAPSAHLQTPLGRGGGTNGVALNTGSARSGGGGALIVRSGGRCASRIVGAGGAVGGLATGAGAAGAAAPCALATLVSSFRHSAIVCGRSFSVNASA